MTTPSAIKASIQSLLEQRAIDASICPSEVARELVPEGQDWRSLMPLIMAVAAKLATDGKIRITQGDVQLDPRNLTGGPVRLRRGSRYLGTNALGRITHATETVEVALNKAKQSAGATAAPPAVGAP